MLRHRTTRLIVIAGLGALMLAALSPVSRARADAPSPRDASYEIQGRTVTLSNGLSDVEAAPGSASRVITRYFGNEAVGDLNGDGLPDVGFLLVQTTGGSGTFYYAVVALKTAGGYAGTNAVLLGDRVAPQTTQALADGTLIVNYADRKPGDAMTTAPSVGTSKYLRVVQNRLVEVSAPAGSTTPPTPARTGNAGLSAHAGTSPMLVGAAALLLVGVVMAARRAIGQMGRVR